MYELEVLGWWDGVTWCDTNLSADGSEVWAVLKMDTSRYHTKVETHSLVFLNNGDVL